MLRGVHPREDHCEDNEKHNANQRFERLALLVLEVARRGCFVVAAFPAARRSIILRHEGHIQNLPYLHP
jgi:hypothetical protein